MLRIPSRIHWQGYNEVDIPVEVGTFGMEEGIEAFRTGTTIATIGVPLSTSDNPEVALREYVNKGKETYYLSRANWVGLLGACRRQVW